MSSAPADFLSLVGKTITEFTVSDDKECVDIKCADGSRFAMAHSQDCCEHVYLDDICGDIAEDIIGNPIVFAEEATQDGSDLDHSDWPDGVPFPEYMPESYTWTFYKLATNKGGITIRWYGSSNGYYSESVDFERII